MDIYHFYGALVIVHRPRVMDEKMVVEVWKHGRGTMWNFELRK